MIGAITLVPLLLFVATALRYGVLRAFVWTTVPCLLLLPNYYTWKLPGIPVLTFHDYAVLAVGVLSLGELSAGKLVETPGSTTLAHVIFEQMHRGVPSDVAALCLVLLIVVGLP